MTTYALNGLGRIGKLALRPLLERGAKIAWLNDDAGDAATLAHLLEFDSVHGRWPAVLKAPVQSIATSTPASGRRAGSRSEKTGRRTPSMEIAPDPTSKTAGQRP